MGMARHEAYTLLLQGEHILEFINGLSTNLVTGPCTTVFTSRAAQIVDVCEVIPVGENVALVGFHPQKNQLIKHLSDRILGQPISISDISDLNDVFIGLPDEPHPSGNHRPSKSLWHDVHHPQKIRARTNMDGRRVDGAQNCQHGTVLRTRDHFQSASTRLWIGRFGSSTERMLCRPGSPYKNAKQREVGPSVIQS